MATQVIILGEEKPTLKPIEFIEFLNGDKTILKCNNTASDYKVIELVLRNYDDKGFDLMLAYRNTERRHGVLYLGHFNDGVV